MTLKDINLKQKNMGKINTILKYVARENLDSIGGSCYMNYFINKNKTAVFGKKTSNKMKIINVEINFRTYCDYWKCSNSRRLKERYKNIIATHYKGRGYIMEELFLDELIKKNIMKRKLLFIILDFIDYGLNDDLDYNEYVAHSCVLILMPNRRKYEAYYINSHGKDMLNYDEFLFKISKHQKRIITYDNPVDMMFVNTFLNFMNEFHNLNIQYDFSETHNYIGVDLQTGDNFGICFIFPYIIWYYFGKYYDKSRWIFSRKKTPFLIKPNRELLKGGKLIECIQGFLVNLNNKYKKHYIKGLVDDNYDREKYVKKLDKILEKSNKYFIKKILNVFVPFFSQNLMEV